MSVSNGLSSTGSQEALEMEGLNGGDKRTRFQVNRVRNESPDKRDTILDMNSNDDETDDDDNCGDLHSVTERTRLNSESDTKYAKSFR